MVKLATPNQIETMIALEIRFDELITADEADDLISQVMQADWDHDDAAWSED